MREASRRGMKNPTVIDVAPGAVTRLLDPFFPEREELRTALLSPVDQLLRWTGKFPVMCHEVEMILEEFAPLHPAHVYVLYADPDLVRAVPESDLVLLNPTDINHDKLLEIGDVVFCYNTILETVDPRKSLENLLHSVRVGGLLSIDSSADWRLNPRTDPMFIGLSENLFLKEF